MLHSDIIKIAGINGWRVSITKSGNGFFFDFQCRTPGGLPFTFTAELSGGCVDSLVDEIVTFVDALDPGQYAAEWAEASGNMSRARYLQAVADMDVIRSRAWLLACDLSEFAANVDRLLNLPWFRRN